MTPTFWLKQGSEPLFPELEWNKPERRDQAGKLLIVGGDQHNLSAPAAAFALLKGEGVGTIKVALPDKTKRLVGDSLPEALFLPSTVSGEFSSEGEVELLESAVWADTILLPGDSGRNSQTTILFEDILRAYKSQVIVTRDAVDILTNNAAQLFEREATTLVVSFAQLQKLVKNYSEPTALVFSMDLVKLVEFLHTFTQKTSATIVTLHQSQLIVAVNGMVSTTKVRIPVDEPKHWRLKLACLGACYQTWNPLKQFEALTYASYILVTKT